MSEYWHSSNDPYTDPDTGLLFNIPNLSSQTQLDRFEALIFQTAAVKAYDYITNVKLLNLQTWQKVHEICFQDVYAWAGKLRTIRIAKGASVFAYPEHIPSEAEKLFKDLNRLLENDAPSFEQLVYFYAETNVLHPFRDGNGRTHRILFSEIFKRGGYLIDYTGLDRNQHIEAIIKSYQGDNGALNRLLWKQVRKN